MLAFTSVYFSGMSLFNGLRPFGVKNPDLVSAPPRGRLRRVRLFDKIGRTLRLRPLSFGLDRLVIGNFADGLQVRLHRRGEVLVDAEVLGHAVDLVRELLARLVVINLVGGGDGLITVEPVERLEIRGDRGNVAGGHGSGRKLNRGSKTVQLQLRMLRATVDRPLLKLPRDDLPDA